MNDITVTVNGIPKTAPAGSLLSDILHGEKPCGGHGKCGKCRVIAHGHLSPLTEAERRILSADEIARGVRFACLTYAIGDCEIESCSQAASARIVTEGALPIVSLDPLFSRYGVAIDIGTTTLAARLYDTQGTLLSEASDLNPQAKWGADVVSRIEAALDGKDEALARSIRNALTDTLSVLAHKANIQADEIDGVVITGNTVMLSLLTEESVEPFSHAPFAVSRFFGETITANDLTLTCLAPATPVYLPPCISAFVGADITCAMLATQLCEGNTALLADIGTNGEMALWHDGKLTVCSTAAGPAFEGVGISMGMRGADGAIDKVTLSEGTLQAHILGDGTPVGICGSGLVDAVACLLENGILDESGCLEDDSAVIADPVALIPKDIRMLQLAKSAICAGLLTLIDSAGLSPEMIQEVSIAGGFGYYLNTANAAKIGLLPAALAHRAQAVGNAALSGASMLLLDRRQQDTCRTLTEHANLLDLSKSPVFSEHYLMGMGFEVV